MQVRLSDNAWPVYVAAAPSSGCTPSISLYAPMPHELFQREVQHLDLECL